MVSLCNDHFVVYVINGFFVLLSFCSFYGSFGGVEGVGVYLLSLFNKFLCLCVCGYHFLVYMMLS